MWLLNSLHWTWLLPAAPAATFRHGADFIEACNIRFGRILAADWMQRRTGIVTALTSDVDRMYAAADPERENLCLYGNADGTWQVRSDRATLESARFHIYDAPGGERAV